MCTATPDFFCGCRGSEPRFSGLDDIINWAIFPVFIIFSFLFLQTTKRSWKPPNLIVNTWKHPSRHRNRSKNIIHWWCPLPNWLPGEKFKGEKNSSLFRDGLVIWRLGNPLGCWEVISWLNRAGSYLVHCHGWFGLWWITAGWQLDSCAPKRRCTSE